MNIYRKIAAACALTTLVAFAAPASAQQPSAAAMTIAREIVDLKGTSILFNPVITGVIESTKLTFLQSNPNLQKDLDAVATALRNDYKPKETEIKENIARIYAKRFTEQELKDTLTFYKSPLGVKIIAEEPKFVDESMQFMDDWSKKLADEVLVKFRAEMKKKGHDL